MAKRIWSRLSVIALVVVPLAGCGESSTPTGPSQPVESRPPAPAPVPAPAPPAPPATPVQPSIVAVTPDAGSTTGSWGAITGSGFVPGATLSLGGTAATVYVADAMTVHFWTAPHAAGNVDLVLTNPGGLAATVPGGFTFAPSAVFDFNGDWVAHAGDDFDIPMELTVRNHAVVRLSCGGTPVPLSSPIAVVEGAFAREQPGETVAGRIASPLHAAGTIDVTGCVKMRWWSERG